MKKNKMEYYIFFVYVVMLLYTCRAMEVSPLNDVQLIDMSGDQGAKSADLMTEIRERFLALETKVKILEEKQKANSKIQKGLHKLITTTKLENGKLKRTLQSLQSAAIPPKEFHEFQIPEDIRINKFQTSKENTRGQELMPPWGITFGVSNKKTLHNVQRVQPSFESMTNTNKDLIRQGSIRFNAQPNKRMTYNGKEIVQFQEVTVNDGNGFNASSGIFTCPQSGLYIFGLTMSASTNLATTYIFQNNNWVARTYVGSEQGTGSVIALLQLKVGDKILVENASHQNNTFDEFSHFTGARISN